MKRSKRFALAAVASLGLAAIAVPVVADQAQFRRDGNWGAGMGMMGAGMGMMGGGAGMMGGAMGYDLAALDTNKDGTLSPEELTAGIQAELRTYDTDANGTLSLEEFAALQAARTQPMTVRAFQMFDVNGDAQVTEAELAILGTMAQGQMRGPQAGPQRMMDNN